MSQFVDDITHCLAAGGVAFALASERLQTEIGITTVEKPYDLFDPTIGLMSRKAPGIQKNGGVYQYASAFKLVADCSCSRVFDRLTFNGYAASQYQLVTPRQAINPT